MLRSLFFIRVILLICLAVTLMACARGKQFDIDESQDTSRNGNYPNFSIKQQAATRQFSQQESQNLANSLNKDAHNVKNVADSYQKNTINTDSENKADAAKREIENTIREIEKSSMQN